MNAEIIGVGTELLLGQIANTNAQKISAALAAAGIDVYLHVVVGDNLDRAAGAIAAAIERSDAVVITGGLGPTPDDLTREAVARATSRGVARDEALAEQIRAIFDSIGRAMPESNLQQADLPEGATPIPPEGTAPGFWLDHEGTIVFALPGVPWEMNAMLQKTVVPMLRERSGSGAIVSREVLVIGLGESATHEKIKDIVDAQSNPTIAYLAGSGRVKVRLTAKAASESEALGLIGPLEEEVRTRLGEDAVPQAEGDVADALGELLREKGVTIAAAESLTGGLIGAQLTAAGGASDFFKGSLVCYTKEAKHAVARVPESILDGPGAVSEEAAKALAEGAALVLNADLGVSATGVAGPAEQEGKPVGTIWVGATFAGRTEARHVRGYGDRDHIRAIAATSALDLGRRLIQG
ncbi:MAG: competence/damage-inducible protein A [Actinomycetota bacterium]|nr:competence/damage-inducible protein A [Actinomycetota bacterium]